MVSINKFKSTTDWKTILNTAKVHKPIYYSLSGSHLYGFNSKDSDFDIRGCHVEELTEVLGLHREKEVRQLMDGELDFESFDIRKELQLILANNSNVLEHLAAQPVYKSKYYAPLKSLADESLSKLVAKPYYGMAQSNLFKYLRTFNESFREAPVKKYLYVLRSLMAGIHILEKHRVEPNINRLNRQRMFKIPVVDELVERKRSGNEKDFIAGNKDADQAIDDLMKWFKVAEENSTLPPSPMTYEKANDFLLEVRMK